jgi:hypothetical protein
MAKPRRRGKPYDPALIEYQRRQMEADEAKRKDRKTRDLLKNAQVAPDEVDDPLAINPGDKIVVLRSTRHDPLFDMKAKKQIDQCDYVAGRHWQAAYENAEIGAVRAIDPSKEAVDGGRLPEVLTDTQRKAMWDIRAARDALGAEGNQLIVDILGKGWSIGQAACERGRLSDDDRRYVGRRFRECLHTLAIRFGYSNEVRK